MKKLIAMIALMLALALCFSACSTTGDNTDGSTSATTTDSTTTSGTTADGTTTSESTSSSETETSESTSVTPGGNEKPQPSNEDVYREALSLIASKDYEAAYEKLESLGDYKDAATLLKHFCFVSTNMNLSSTEGSLTYDVECVYDENNLLTELYYVESYRSESETQEVKSTILLEYDEKHNLVKVSCVDSENNVESTIEYTYDEDGNLLKETNFDKESNSGHTTEYTYDENGNLIKKFYTVVSDASTDTSTISETTTEYTYDENGMLIEETETYNYTSGNIKFTSITMIDCSYDENGYLIKKEYFQIRNGEKIPDSYYEYIYDENGNLTQELRGTSNNPATLQTEYTYNENGHLIKKESGSVLEYTVDEHGNILGATFSGGGDGTFVVERDIQLVYIPFDLPETTQEMLNQYYNALTSMF